MYKTSYNTDNYSEGDKYMIDDNRLAEENAQAIIDEGGEPTLVSDGYKFGIPTVNVNFWNTIPVIKRVGLDVIMDRILSSGHFPPNNRIRTTFESDTQFYYDYDNEIVLNGNVVAVLTLFNVNSRNGEYFTLKTKFIDNKIIYPYELASGSSVHFKSYYFNGKQGFLLLSDMIVCYVVNTNNNTKDVYKFYLPLSDQRDPDLRLKLLYEKFPQLRIFKNMFNGTVPDNSKITSFIDRLINHELPGFRFITHYKFDSNNIMTRI